ncbi:MAG: hypothetical protein C1942_00845 [Prosthecochloris sp.]|nr:hypothetical protein [Prosthecochloris sp.]
MVWLSGTYRVKAIVLTNIGLLIFLCLFLGMTILSQSSWYSVVSNFTNETIGFVLDVYGVFVVGVTMEAVERFINGTLFASRGGELMFTTGAWVSGVLLFLVTFALPFFALFHAVFSMQKLFDATTTKDGPRFVSALSRLMKGRFLKSLVPSRLSGRWAVGLVIRLFAFIASIVALYTLGSALFLTMAAIAGADFADAFDSSYVLVIVFGSGIVFSWFAVLLWRLGSRLIKPSADALLDRDERGPIVLLRSFTDDNARLKPKGMLAQMQRRKLRLEELIAAVLSPLGSLVAIGAPGELLPKLGASRAYFADEEWKPAVLDWISRSKAIVMVAGRTPSVLWEMQQIIATGALDKLIILFPPGDIEERSARWHHISTTIEFVDVIDNITELKDVVAAKFGSDGPTLIVRSSAHRQSDYELALLACLHANGSAMAFAPVP